MTIEDLFNHPLNKRTIDNINKKYNVNYNITDLRKCINIKFYKDNEIFIDFNIDLLNRTISLNDLISGFNLYFEEYKTISFELGFVAKIDNKDYKFINLFSSIQKYDSKDFIKKLKDFKIYNSMLINPIIKNERTRLSMAFLLQKILY